MVSASGPDFAETYSYDEVGNRLSKNGVTYTYNAGDQLVSASDGSSFTYDNDGNLRTRTQGGGTTTYSWDSNDRLVRVDLPDGSYVAYTYDSMDNRVSRRGTDGSMTYYVYDGLDLVQEVNAAGVVIANYVYDGLDHPLSMARGGVTAYYVYDGQGNVTALVNAAGAVLASYRYDPWGNTLSVGGSQPSLANPFRFSGREWDAETGLYFLRARYYDPQLGRFISPDPASIIRDYVYAANNPINNSDPTGLSSWRVGGPLRPGYDAKMISEILDFVKKMSPKSTERYMIRHYLFALKDPEAVRIFRAFYQFAPTGATNVAYGEFASRAGAAWNRAEVMGRMTHELLRHPPMRPSFASFAKPPPGLIARFGGTMARFGGRTAVKVALRAGARLIPVVGTALLVIDVAQGAYGLYKWWRSPCP